jgi:hypothetical protein
MFALNLTYKSPVRVGGRRLSLPTRVRASTQVLVSHDALVCLPDD